MERTDKQSEGPASEISERRRGAAVSAEIRADLELIGDVVSSVLLAVRNGLNNKPSGQVRLCIGVSLGCCCAVRRLTSCTNGSYFGSEHAASSSDGLVVASCGTNFLTLSNSPLSTTMVVNFASCVY